MNAMTRAAGGKIGVGLRAPLPTRYARWLVIAINIVQLTQTGVYITFGYRGEPTRGGGTALLVAAAMVTVWLCASLPVMRGERPRHPYWLLAAMIVLTVVPTLWLGRYFWGAGCIAVMATGLLVLRRWWAVVAFVVPTLLTVGYDMVSHPTLTGSLFYAQYGLTSLPIAAGQLYISVRFVGVLDALSAARGELAETAVNRERMRISRDLHDLLGQSLSAISLKGDLAIRLLPVDRGRAREEIRSLIAIARQASRDLRLIPRGDHRVSLETELAGAVKLLDAAGVRVDVDVRLPDLPVERAEVLAWTVREGVTNLLRHSDAQNAWISVATISATEEHSGVRLEIHNDGAGEPGSTGTGLVGLAERAAALNGSLRTNWSGDGTYQLILELP